MIIFLVLTILPGSWCLVGLIGLRRTSGVHHIPPPQTEHLGKVVQSTPVILTRSETKRPRDHRTLLHSFRCEMHVLKSMIRDHSLSLSEARNLILLCSPDSSEENFSKECSQSVRKCTTMTARDLVLESGCSPIDRMLYCLDKTEVSDCFKSFQSVKFVVSHLQRVCSRHREDQLS
ncbi:uncharacterized protein LOC134283064 [Saccostrea cucullata]|uniref:uncharacterized protein LOC134283064 n=1 Tax=Saccostrea cuccullata TaxID=36930 RepID=UPI002ED13BE8